MPTLSSMTNSVLKQTTPGGSPFYETQIATASDSVSALSSANACGGYQYSISITQTTASAALSTADLTIDSTTGVIQLYTANFNTVGTHTATVTVKLASYPSPTVSVTFTITIIDDPCISTVISTVPASIENLVAFAGYTVSSKLKYPFNDTGSI